MTVNLAFKFKLPARHLNDLQRLICSMASCVHKMLRQASSSSVWGFNFLFVQQYQKQIQTKIQICAFVEIFIPDLH